MSIYTSTFALLALLPFSFAAPLVGHPAPIRRAVDVGGRSADGGYIVAIKPNTVDPQNRGRWLNSVLTTNGVTPDKDTTESLKLKWDKDVFNGLAGTFSTQAVNALRDQPEVAWIEEDIVMHTSALFQQGNAAWGVARLSTNTASFVGQNPNLLDFKYTFEDAPGIGTEAFVVDTGCRADHSEFDFGKRAKFIQTFGSGTPGVDKNGHGTHVAGTIGGTVVGVAKNATINCIKVMADDGSGATSDIISGINLAKTLADGSGKPCVISMSLGGPINTSLDAAVSNVIRGGIPFIVAAGNESQDANNVSPARVPEAITVGATTINDTFASFSNFGSRVDILAPGQDILSASPKATDTLAILSGTSMATPHISGLALTIMGKEGKLSAQDLMARLNAIAVPGIITAVDAATTNTFAFNGVQI